MSTLEGLNRENSETIGFVIAAVFCAAISKEELRGWAVSVIGANEVDAVPQYVFELADFNERLPQLFKIVGFVPHWTHTEDENLALHGIAFKRKREVYNPPVPAEVALAKLQQNPHVETRFRKTFPFIDF
jgi:hypothetical protein